GSLVRFVVVLPRPPQPHLFPYTTLFRSPQPVDPVDQGGHLRERANFGELLVTPVHVSARRLGPHDLLAVEAADDPQRAVRGGMLDRKSTRLNSSHVEISYAVFCLKKKKK